MAKYGAVDRMMDLATSKTPRERAEGDRKSSAEAVLERQVSATEPVLAAAKLPQTVVTPAVTGDVAEPVPTPASTTLAAPAARPGERGRRILDALRPLLPAVGGMLRMVDHGGVQTVARLLPLLAGGGPTLNPAGSAQGPAASAAEQRQIAALLLELETQHQAITEELHQVKEQLQAREEQFRRTRESLERTVAEQGTLAHLLHQLGDRSRLLTAAVILLFMLVIAQMTLFVIFMHR
ncbi:hypothetical protein [Acidipila sp. EB88]|uniref:hypothetical protein n=1 Tax=Acidipila sp. EB88 TaxID=2305226 RepID=UPI000F5F8CEE|nr:hypothetical protein [Acidipila sp. EB88]